MLTGAVKLLLAWILLGTAVAICHLAVTISAIRTGHRYRWLALVPPAAPVIAWLGGRRVGPVIWVLLVVAYVVLRFMEGTV